MQEKLTTGVITDAIKEFTRLDACIQTCTNIEQMDALRPFIEEHGAKYTVVLSFWNKMNPLVARHNETMKKGQSILTRVFNAKYRSLELEMTLFETRARLARMKEEFSKLN